MAFSHRCEDEPEEDEESTEQPTSHHVPTNIVQGDCIAVTFVDGEELKTMIARICQINRLTKKSGGEGYKKTWCPKFEIDKDAYPVEGKYQLLVEYFHGDDESDFTEPRYIDVGIESSDEGVIESKGAHEKPRYICIA